MNSRRNAAQKLERESANAGVPPRRDQVPLLEDDVNDDKAPLNPPLLTDENKRVDVFQMSQPITTQA